MKYDPRDRQSREALATAIRAQMKVSGFTKASLPGTKEETYARGVLSDIRVVVYTTIEGNLTRKVAKDAIRVVALYKGKDGHERGIAKAEKRVNRTGDIGDIVDRTLSRMRGVFEAAKNPSRCEDCGAPQFTSKKGNEVCADLCWRDAPKGNNFTEHYGPLPGTVPNPAPSGSGFSLTAVEAAMTW